jgi:hypothetical protein
MAYVQGTYEMDVTPPGMTVALHDKYKSGKQSDGAWKVVEHLQL